MFEFFKFAADEMRGVDHAERVRQSEEAARDEKKVILPRSIRCVIYALGTLYLVISVLSVALLKRSHAGIESYIMYVILGLLDLSVLICVSIRTKKTELAAITGVILFAVLLFVFV